MKKIMVLLFLFNCCQSYSQQKGKFIFKSTAVFLSGMSDGFNQSLLFRYQTVKEEFNLNDQFWNPDISWRNKWKNGDFTQGEKFLGSSTIFVGFTDGYHMTRMISQGLLCTSIVINLSEKKKKWLTYLEEGFAYYLLHGIGFYLMYNVIIGGYYR